MDALKRATQLLRDARTAAQLLRREGIRSFLSTAHLTRSRRSNVDSAVSPDSPIAWADTLRRLRRHYALDAIGEVTWSESEARRDIHRINALSRAFVIDPGRFPVVVERAKQVRHALATIEALRSWPNTRSLPIVVQTDGLTVESWHVLKTIAHVELAEGSGLHRTEREVSGTSLRVVAGQLPLPHWPIARNAAGRDQGGVNPAQRLLILSPHVPDIKTGSGSQDMYWFARHAVDLGYEVLFVPTHAKVGDTRARWDLRLAGVQVINSALSTQKISSALPRAMARTDIVATFDKQLTVKAREIINTVSATPRLLFIPLDLKQFPQRVLVEHNMGAELRGFGLHVPTDTYVAELAEAENAAIRASDRTALISTDELVALSRTDFADRLVHLPMLRSDLKFVGLSEGQPRLVFVAGFRHPPNYVAVAWFLDKVWPQVHQHCPGLSFEIHGADLNPLWRERWEKLSGVIVCGPYDEEHEPYEGDVVAVAPLRYGGGTKGKVVGAMGHGAVVVGTRFAAQGLPPLMQDSIVVADSADHLAGRLVEVLNDGKLRQRLRTLGRQAFEADFSVSAGREHVAKILAEL